MTTGLSRRKIAAFAVDRLDSGAEATQMIKEVAAFLVDTRRERELDLVIRDIEAELATRGKVIADVASAYPLTDTLRQQIGERMGADELYFRETVEAELLGGVRVDIPGGRFDGTLRHRLMALKAKQL